MSTSESPRALHVVLGAGQIGTLLAEALLARGHRVRQVRRGRPGPARPGLEWRSGDLSDPGFARAAAQGAAVLYHVANAPYDDWMRLLLPLTRGILAGAAASGARLVMLDNLYGYGRPTGPLREDSPVAPCSKKGELRARQSEEVLAAHARGHVRATIGRASDFFGPQVTLASAFGERNWKRLLAGRSAEVLGDPDQPHSYSYSHDVAAGLLTLGARDEALGRVWHLPVAPAESTRALLDRVVAALGMGPAARISALPDWVLRGVGLVWPMAREIAEMTYQWRAPFVLDDTRFREAFGGRATPVDDAVAATVAWARQVFAPAVAAVVG